MIKKNQIGLFVNTSTTASTTTWTRIKKSTSLSIAMNAETEENDFIADATPTTELTSYKPEIEQPLKMIDSEADFEYFWGKYYDMTVGEDAKSDFLIVFMFDYTEESSTKHYKAWKGTSTIIFDEMNCTDSELSFNLALSDIESCTCTMTNGTPTVDSE